MGVPVSIKTSKSAGARGDVQNFGGCQAPAAPVLTQALVVVVVVQVRKNLHQTSSLVAKNKKKGVNGSPGILV